MEWEWGREGVRDIDMALRGGAYVESLRERGVAKTTIFLFFYGGRSRIQVSTEVWGGVLW